MDIKAFREQYPQYNSMSDQDLADSLHQKYYNDIPKEQFYTTFGISPPQPQQPREPGWGEAFALGIDQPLENMAQTARLGGYNKTADALSGAITAPSNVESPSARFINPRPEDWQVAGYGVGSMPKAIFEQAGQIGGSILTRLGGAAVGGAVGGIGGPVTGTLGAGVGSLAGPFIFEAVQTIGPVAYERAKNNGRQQPNEEDIDYALGTAAASGAFNALGAQFLPGGGAAIKSTIKRYLMSGVGEGVTETGQAFIQQAGETVNTDKGLTLNPREAIGEGLLGAGAGTAAQGVASVASTAKETVNKLKDDVTTPVDEEAAKRVSARINLYEAQGYDVMDVDPTSDKGAKQILTGINMELGNEIKQLHDKLKPLLAPSQDSELQDILNRAALNTAVRKGVNRLKSGMTDENIAKVEQLVGNTEEGFALVEKLKEAREIGRMYQKGVKGGVSRFTDMFLPTTEGGVKATIQNAMFTGSLAGAAATGGASLAAQTAAVVAGRAIDKLTGNRSRVAKYARVNSDPNVLTPNITPPSGLRSLTGEQEQARRQAEAQQQARQAARAQAAQIRVAEQQRQERVRNEARRMLRDDIVNDRVPGGGVFNLAHTRHGLKPGQVVIGLNRMAQSGEIDAEVARMFIDQPEALMQGNAGNQILDRLGRMADAGTIQRDPDWKPQAAQGPTTEMPGRGPTMTSATRQPPMDERRRIAYEQQARANQDRVSQTINAIQADQRIPEAIKPRLLEAAALIGKTNNKQEAQKIADGVDEALSFDTSLKMIAQTYLQPLVDQIRHTVDPNGPKPQAMRRSEAKITAARTKALIDATTKLADEITTKREALAKAQSGPNATQSGTVDLNTLTPSQRGRSAIEILRGPDAKKGSRTVTEVAKALQERARSDGRGKFTTSNRTPDIDDELATMIAAEAVEELGNSRNASDWYSREMQKALNAAALIHPELKSDPIARMVFNLALAITSQGVVVSDNANYAMRWYEAYKASVPSDSTDFRGQFPEEGWGKAAPSIIANARKMNAMIASIGTQDTMDFLNAQFTVKELEDAGFKIGGENKGTLVWGSAILGPKIGNGFYQNLAGNFSPVTIDMWLMRLWGRMTGNSIGIEEAAQKKQEDRLREALRGDNYFDPSMYESTEGLFEVAEEIFRDWEREFRQYGSKGLKDGTIVKTEKIKAAERLLHGRDQPIDAPSSAAVRNWIRDVMNIAQAKLQAQGINVTNADLQAIIWYPEKRLWTKKMGSREKGSGEDGAQSAGETSYMHEFARIARERGYSDGEIQQAIQSSSGAGSGSGPVRSTAGRTDAQGQQIGGTDETQTGGWGRKDQLLAGALAINKGITPEAAKAARMAALAKQAVKKTGKGKKKNQQDTE